PQWAGSCWYYLRFISPQLASAFVDPDEEKYWMPVDLYVGGSEHATLHLLYARFWHQVLHDLGHVSTREPFARLFCQGMIHATSFRDSAGKYYYPDQVEERDGQWVVKDSGQPVATKLDKMSKSRYNVVNPDDMCRDYGADALRLYELFMGPLEDGVEWETSGVAGTRRFLDRLWRVVVADSDTEAADSPAEPSTAAPALSAKLVAEPVDNRALERALHAAIKKVSESIDALRFNTAVAEMMVFVNEATKAKAVPIPWVDAFVRILAPFAPHVAEELWQRLGHEGSITYAPWPEYDEAKLATETFTLAVQVNGKLRATVEVATDISKEDALAAARAQDKIAALIADKTMRREIYVPGRLVNLVVS
ncbi:MAG: class I tRNA ligase family protein, partial [Myxococcota bacterium]